MKARTYSVLAKLFKLVNFLGVHLCCYMVHGMYGEVFTKGK